MENAALRELVRTMQLAAPPAPLAPPAPPTPAAGSTALTPAAAAGSTALTLHTPEEPAGPVPLPLLQAGASTSPAAMGDLNGRCAGPVYADCKRTGDLNPPIAAGKHGIRSQAKKSNEWFDAMATLEERQKLGPISSGQEEPDSGACRTLVRDLANLVVLRLMQCFEDKGVKVPPKLVKFKGKGENLPCSAIANYLNSQLKGAQPELTTFHEWRVAHEKAEADKKRDQDQKRGRSPASSKSSPSSKSPRNKK